MESSREARRRQVAQTGLVNASTVTDPLGEPLQRRSPIRLEAFEMRTTVVSVWSCHLDTRPRMVMIPENPIHVATAIIADVFSQVFSRKVVIIGRAAGLGYVGRRDT